MGHINEHAHKGCFNKRTFETRKEAKRFCKGKHPQAPKRLNPNLKPYCCSVCGLYHVTSQDEDFRQAMKGDPSIPLGIRISCARSAQYHQRQAAENDRQDDEYVARCKVCGHWHRTRRPWARDTGRRSDD